MRYQLIRDKRIFDLDETEIEMCDDKHEINIFSIKEIINLLSELQETDCSDADIYVDIYTILNNLVSNNSISHDLINKVYEGKLIKYGGFSKFLLKIH